jgi:hypothetical protein
MRDDESDEGLCSNLDVGRSMEGGRNPSSSRLVKHVGCAVAVGTGLEGLGLMAAKNTDAQPRCLCGSGCAQWLKKKRGKSGMSSKYESARRNGVFCLRFVRAAWWLSAAARGFRGGLSDWFFGR